MSHQLLVLTFNHDSQNTITCWNSIPVIIRKRAFPGIITSGIMLILHHFLKFLFILKLCIMSNIVQFFHFMVNIFPGIFLLWWNTQCQAADHRPHSAKAHGQMLYWSKGLCKAELSTGLILVKSTFEGFTMSKDHSYAMAGLWEDLEMGSMKSFGFRFESSKRLISQSGSYVDSNKRVSTQVENLQELNMNPMI